MRLIGMLDSPYVRRTAVSLTLLELDYALEQVSVLRSFDEFKAINPVVKAPSLIIDDGTVLMDSGLIIDYAEKRVGRSLMPTNGAEFTRALRLIGLALAACEKTVQIVYENHMRPPEKRHQPWLDRISGQLLSAYGALEREVGDWPSAPLQPDLTAAIAWRFTQHTITGIVPASSHPRLVANSAKAEKHLAFLKTTY
jgi:glutathione S-transferase